jgi:putative ABC transport system permease protein
VKYLPLILANLLRKKIRTTLTLGSFMVALFLYGILVAVRGAFSQGVEVAGLDRLVVTNKVSIIQPLPLAYRERLLRIPGVKQVTDFSWFGGVYKDEKNFFPQFAFDQETFREMFPEFKVPEQQWQALLATKTGAIAGAVTAKRFGWKVGDRIPIRATYYQGGTWEFELVGIYRGTRPQDDESWFLFRRDFLEEKSKASREARGGLTGWYYAKLANPNDALKVTKAIDEQFANSAHETRTQTEKELAMSFAKQMGNIEFLILAIGSVVFFTLLLVSGNTMAIAVRERVGELAVMKAVGYGDGFVLGLVMFESMLISLLGGGAGLLLVKAFSMRGDPTGGMLPVFYIPAAAMAFGFALAAAVGAAAGVIPALSASRLRVIEALRRL